MYRKKQQTVQQVRNPSGQKQMSRPSTSMHGQGVELGATEKQLQLVTRVGFESGVKEVNSSALNHSDKLPPKSSQKLDRSFVKTGEVKQHAVLKYL